MSILSKITDFVMPVDDEEEYEEELEEDNKKATDAAAKPAAAVVQDDVEEETPMRRAAAGSGGYAYAPSYAGYSSPSSVQSGFRPSYAPPASNISQNRERPQLTVHTTKKDEISVQLCTPTEYGQAADVANDLGSGRAVIVNYEKVQPDVQRRMCDFTNGVCYAIDGDVKRISDKIVIYVPEGIDVGDALTMTPSAVSSMMSR